MKHLISAHQPSFCAWPGYLHRILLSDEFIILDNVQFEKGSYINRNQILGPNGVQWITVPVLTSSKFKARISDLEICQLNRWRAKMVRSIESCYAKAPFFDAHISFFREVLLSDDSHDLNSLCHKVLMYLLECFGINTPIKRLSELECEGSKNTLILSICKRLDATHFLFGPNGKNYVDDKVFVDAGIVPMYHEFRQAPYPQLWGHDSFSRNLSAIDMLFNLEGSYLLDWLTKENMTQDMLVGRYGFEHKVQ